MKTVTTITSSHETFIGPVISEADTCVDRIERIDDGSADETAVVPHYYSYTDISLFILLTNILNYVGK